MQQNPDGNTERARKVRHRRINGDYEIQTQNGRSGLGKIAQ
jgi:hypothetical protein